MNQHAPKLSLQAVDSYQNCDFSPQSPAKSELMARVASEAARGTNIDLTPSRTKFSYQQPAALTPAMAAWFASRVAGPRGKAIAAISSGFQSQQMADGSPTAVLFEVERDDARSRHLTNQIDQAAQFLDHNRPLIDRVNRARFEFNTLKARHGREPVPRRTWAYIAALLVLVVLEAFINFESFLRVPYITSPFLATAVTFAVAIAVATASHHHGIVIRQWNYLFSPQDPGDKSHGSRQGDATRRLAIGAFLIFLALAIVAGSRYYYLKDVIAQAVILGQRPPSMVGGIVFMVLGNVVAYVVGTLAAYSMHDPDPNFAEKFQELTKSETKLTQLKERRLAQQETQRRGLDNALNSAANQSNAVRGPNHAELRSMVEQILEKDQEVLSALMDYRNELISLMNAEDDKPVFRLPDGASEEVLPSSLDKALTPRQYASETLVLGFSAGEG